MEKKNNVKETKGVKPIVVIILMIIAGIAGWFLGSYVFDLLQ